MGARWSLILTCSNGVSEVWEEIKRWKPDLIRDNMNDIQDLMAHTERRTAGSPCWGMEWLIIGAVTWSIWCERNRRMHEGRELLVVELDRRVIEDSKIVFRRDRFKKRGIV